MNKKIKDKFNSYPPKAQTKMMMLRDLILDVAKSDTDIDFIGEDLKWGEPSFLTKSSGSTLRIDWKEKQPDVISIYVNCRTKLISIFMELYPEDFKYIGNREVQLPLKGKLPKKKLTKCIELALKYNLVKDKF